MSTEEDREALAVELREVYLRTPGNRGMDAYRWVAVADAAIAALRRPVQGEYEAGYAEGFHDGLSTPRGTAEDDRTPAPAPRVTERQVRYDDGEWSREVEVVPAPQVTDEMVERAAYGMYLARPIELGQGGQDDWAILPDEWKHEWREAAYAALEAALGVSE